MNLYSKVESNHIKRAKRADKGKGLPCFAVLFTVANSEINIRKRKEREATNVVSVCIDLTQSAFQ